MAKAKAKPEWQRLIERCQRLWAAYDKAPTKANLEKFGAHLEKMKVSKSMKVKAERTRGARAFRQQWKAAGYHMAAKKPAKRKSTKKKAAKRRAPRKNPGYTVMLEHVDGRHKIGHGETTEQAEDIASKQLGRPVKVDFHSTELVSGNGGQLYFIEGPELSALQDSILYIEAGSGNWDPEDEMNIRYAPLDSRGEIDREEWLDAVRGIYMKGFALTRTGSLEEERAWHADKDSSWWRFHGLTDAEIRYVTGWSDIVPNPKPKRKAAKKKATKKKASRGKPAKKKGRKNPGERFEEVDYEGAAQESLLADLRQWGPTSKAETLRSWMDFSGAEKEDFTAAWEGALEAEEIEKVSDDEYRITPKGSNVLVRFHRDDPWRNPRKRSKRKATKRKPSKR